MLPLFSSNQLNNKNSKLILYHALTSYLFLAKYLTLKTDNMRRPLFVYTTTPKKRHKIKHCLDFIWYVKQEYRNIPNKAYMTYRYINIAIDIIILMFILILVMCSYDMLHFYLINPARLYILDPVPDLLSSVNFYIISSFILSFIVMFFALCVSTKYSVKSNLTYHKRQFNQHYSRLFSEHTYQFFKQKFDKTYCFFDNQADLEKNKQANVANIVCSDTYDLAIVASDRYLICFNYDDQNKLDLQAIFAVTDNFNINRFLQKHPAKKIFYDDVNAYQY